MLKINPIVCLLLLLIVAVCFAEPPRPRSQRVTARRPSVQRLRLKPVPARQSVETVTPYPSASELKPEVPFEPESQPELIYGPPDQTYGPPDVDQLPTTNDPQAFAPNPEIEEFLPARLQNRRPNQVPLTGKLQATAPQKLAQISALPALPSVPVPVPVAASPQYILVNQPFAYTAQFQSW